MNIIFATNNYNKVKEIQSFTNDNLNFVSLEESGVTEEIEEPYETFRENAWAKAMYVYEKTGQPCFAEDSGLVVPALDGAPGVLSARYAGEHGNDRANNAKLLYSLENVLDKSAYYKAVICLVLNKNEVYYFEGECWGHIADMERGEGGFGYDPLFVPIGYSKTFGELGMEIKKAVSHRSAAVGKLVSFLNVM